MKFEKNLKMNTILCTIAIKKIDFSKNGNKIVIKKFNAKKLDLKRKKVFKGFHL